MMVIVILHATTQVRVKASTFVNTGCSKTFIELMFDRSDLDWDEKGFMSHLSETCLFMTCKLC